MSAATWKDVLVIALGSAAGVLIRQALFLVVPRALKTSSGVTLAGTSILGGLIGAAMGGIVMSSALTAEQQGHRLIGLIAALGTFGASAVLTASTPPIHATAFLRTAAVHIALAILAAVLGFGIIHFVRSASG